MTRDEISMKTDEKMDSVTEKYVFVDHVGKRIRGQQNEIANGEAEMNSRTVKTGTA